MESMVYKFFLFMIFIFLTNFVFAYGPSTPYWGDNPLYLNPGESTTFNITLQNLVGDINITLRARIGENPIARLTDGDPHDYFIPFGSDDIKVPIFVEIPYGVKIGEKYNVGVSFREVSSGEGGTVSISTESLINFPVIVGKEKPKLAPSPELGQSSFSIYWTVFTIILALGSLITSIYLINRVRKMS